jgi:thiol-disulfide isomerase/thioredoxin
VNPAKVLVVTVLAGSLSIGLALFGERWLSPPDAASGGPRHSPGTLASLPDIRLRDLAGREVASNAWAGKVVIINYWATWCPPCLREMPMLARLQEGVDKGQLQVIGIAIDEPSAVRRFIEENAVGYPILLGGADAIELSRQLGNRTGGLPFTVVFDSSGRRVFSQTGELTAERIRQAILPLVATKTG